VKRTGKRARQKEVDILIAVDMLTHSYRRNMNRVTLLAGDQDFRPLVDALVRDGMFVELCFEPKSASTDLADTADTRKVIDPYVIESWLEESFRKSHAMPKRHVDFSPTPDRPHELRRGGVGNDGPVYLYGMEGGFEIVQTTASEGHFLHLRHPDQETLLMVHEMTYGSFEWSE